jgi:integrase
MGKIWRHYQLGPYRLGHLNGQAVATWRGEHGHRHRERLGAAATETAARALLAAFVAARSTLSRTATLTVAEIFAAYTRDREIDGKQTAAFHDNWKALGAMFGPLPPHLVTADLCRAYAAERISQGRSVGTVWTELTRLRSALNWAQKRRTIDVAPYVWVPSKPAGKSRVLTPGELERLLAGAVMPHIRLFVILGIATAARTGALLDLTWDRVDLAAHTLDLRRAAPVNPLSKAARKGRAVVWLNDWARAALAEAGAGRLTEHVIEWNGAPVRSIRKGFMEACRRAQIEGVTPHTLRHTAASWMASRDIDMERIAKFLGHSSPAVTRAVYAKPETASLAGAAEVVQLPKRAVVR